MKIGGTLGEWSDKTKEVVQQTGEKIEGVFENTVEDITKILGDVGDCAAAADRIRIRVMERSIEYQTEAMRTMLDAHFLTREIIEEVWRMVDLDIRRDPNPKIYHLTNLNSSSSAIEVDIGNFEFPEGRYPCLFVHGMGYDASSESAFSFFKDFEDEVKVFDQDWYKNHDIYLVSYDTNLTDEMESKIRAAFALLLGIQPIGEATPLVFAVFWRELERRATITGDFILDFFKKLARFNDNLPYSRGFAITHSLGCFTLASAAQKLMKENDRNNSFQNWLCMAAAIPASGFAGTGSFNLAPFIAGGTDGPKYGTSVWYSRMDLVLNIAYTLATGHLAMGVTGPLESRFEDVTSMDVTQQVREDHFIQYFERIKTELSDVFQII